jgi:hypothetical protein
MSGRGEEPIAGGIAVQGATLVAAIGLAVLIILYLTRDNRDHFARAARPGLNGPDIEMLEKQNQAYERIIHASTPAIGGRKAPALKYPG